MEFTSKNDNPLISVWVRNEAIILFGQWFASSEKANNISALFPLHPAKDFMAQNWFVHR